MSDIIRLDFLVEDCCKQILCYMICGFCAICQLNSGEMAAVPQGAFIARKVRENEERKAKEFPMCTTENPMKYSSKYMNSIWGMYNRYSVHNLKQNFDLKGVLETKNQQKSSVGLFSAEKNSADFKGSLWPKADFI